MFWAICKFAQFQNCVIQIQYKVFKYKTFKCCENAVADCWCLCLIHTSSIPVVFFSLSIPKFLFCALLFWNCIRLPHNFKIGFQLYNFYIVQRNFENVQICKLCGIYTCTYMHGMVHVLPSHNYAKLALQLCSMNTINLFQVYNTNVLTKSQIFRQDLCENIGLEAKLKTNTQFNREW